MNPESFQDFLNHPNEESLFTTPTDAHEVNSIISLLDSDKSICPNNLPTKILKLLKNEISTHLDILIYYMWCATKTCFGALTFSAIY